MRRNLLVLGSILLIAGLFPRPVGAAQSQLPNLVALPSFDVRIDRADDGPGRALRFSTSVANRSEFGFDLIGVPGGTDTAAAEQCTSWAGPRVCSERSNVGRFVWHPEHGHHHFEAFELYELRKLNKNGAPDMSKKGLVASGGKVSFCLLDYEPDGPTDDPLYSLPHPLYAACASGAQGISPGWRDTYTFGLYGQQILLRGVPDGTYAIVVTVDPDKRLFETTRSDNVSATRITLSHKGRGVGSFCYYEDPAKRCR